jgi:PKD repeat protein
MSMVLVYNVGNNDTITLPLFGSVNVSIDWDDGSEIENFTTSGNKNHTYTTAGEYEVSISGTLTQFGNGLTGYSNADKFIEVSSFGNIGLISLSGAFKNAINLVSVPSSLPSSVIDLSHCFHRASLINDSNITNWDVSNVKYIDYMFYRASSFNQNIFIWTPTNLEKYTYMLYKATKFNQPFSGWIVNKIIDFVLIN